MRSRIGTGSGVFGFLSDKLERYASRQPFFLSLARVMQFPGAMLMGIFSLFLTVSTTGSPPEIWDNAQIYLNGIEGLSLEEDKGQVTLNGEVHRLSDQRRIRQFLKKFPHVHNRSRLSQEALSAYKHNPKLVGKDHDLLSLDSGPAHQSAQPTIFLEIALVEIKRSALQKLGTRMGTPISFEAGLDFNLIRSAARNAGVKSLDPIRLFLDLAMQHGEARVHAKQSVVAENGKMGEFQVGGEFPIKMVSGLVSRVDFKSYGLIIKFIPRLQSASTVHLGLDSEMSEIDMGSMVDGIPVILKKHLKTQLYAHLNETMAIGGIVRSSQSQMTDQIPGLSAIPGLGRLFESEDFKRQKSEAYIFITPKKMDQPWLPSPEL